MIYSLVDNIVLLAFLYDLYNTHNDFFCKIDNNIERKLFKCGTLYQYTNSI